MNGPDRALSGTLHGIELVAIDLDGTLVDSVKDLYEAVVEMQIALSLEVPDEQAVRGWVGNGITRLVHRALTGDMQRDAEPALLEQALGEFNNAYGRIIGRHSTLYPGVLQTLQWMASEHVPLVMVTNKASLFANRLLKQLEIDHFFDHKIGGDDVVSPKPDPEALLLAAKLCAVSPGHSVLIGDSISDFKAARAAGFQSVGVSYGYNHGMPVRELESILAPDAVVDSFLELPKVLRQLADTVATP